MEGALEEMWDGWNVIGIVLRVLSFKKELFLWKRKNSFVFFTRSQWKILAFTQAAQGGKVGKYGNHKKISMNGAEHTSSNF